ncbi:MAG: acylphosphatase [Rubrobacter sp.]|nr:acylphosphatase [Rubrobacter sp.]
MQSEGNEGAQRARVRVSGRVQGVFFRDSTREKAESLRLTGWVENLPDGRVEAVFEGPPDKVREMVEWCEAGPPHAEVEDVETNHEPPENDLSAFEVR